MISVCVKQDAEGIRMIDVSGHAMQAPHGEDLVCTKFSEQLRTEFGYQADAPFSGSEFDLAAGTWIRQTVGVPVREETEKQKRNRTIFELLVAAGERLMRVIRKNKESANKDIKKFTEEINALCEKWDRGEN